MRPSLEKVHGVNETSTISMELTGTVESWEAVALLCGLTLAAVLLALAYNSIRRWLYGDIHSLDVAYDAGGEVSSSLTAVGLVGQLLWPMCLLQSSINFWDTRLSISAGLWNGLPIIIATLLFPMLTLSLKTRAPGAKTYLQVVEARFGRHTHLLYTIFALLVNLVSAATLLVAGATLFKTVVKDISDEMAVLLMAVLFGSHTFVGGLGAIFYVSYFNVATIMCVLSYVTIKAFYISPDDLNTKNFTSVYAETGTFEDSSHENLNDSGLSSIDTTISMAFWSVDSLVRSAKGTLLSLTLVFCDQATWQSKIAAKPMQGTLGFFGASLICFTIVASLGTSASYVYFALGQDISVLNYNPANFTQNNFSSNMEANASITNDIEGLLNYLNIDFALGKYGGIGLILIFSMVAMPAGSRGVKAVSSIIVYDLYQKYVQPFRTSGKSGHCLLCEQPMLGETITKRCLDEADVHCCCPSVIHCRDCISEKEVLMHSGEETLIFDVYSCPVHGQYRAYQDWLATVHRWVVLSVACCVIPVGMLVITSHLKVGWMFSICALMALPAVPGIVLSLTWVKTSSQGLIAGSVSGLLCAVAVNLACAASQDVGLWNFLTNTAGDIPVLAGSATSLTVSLCVTVAFSLATHTIRSPADEAKEWQKLRDIDNPLSPWHQRMRRSEVAPFNGRRLSYLEMKRLTRPATMVALVGCFTLLAIFVLIIPGCVSSVGTMTSSKVQYLSQTLQILCLVITALIVILPPIEEIWAIWCRLRKKRKTAEGGGERNLDHLSHKSMDMELKTGLILKD